MNHLSSSSSSSSLVDILSPVCLFSSFISSLEKKTTKINGHTQSTHVSNRMIIDGCRPQCLLLLL